MKTSSDFMSPSCSTSRQPGSLILRSLVLVAVLAASFVSSIGHAQTPDRQARKTAHRQAVAEAKDLAARGNLDAAEQALGAVNPAPRDSALWHFDLAQRLTLLAGNLARSGQTAEARATAQRALRSLEKADALASEPNLRAGIRQQTGFIQERYVGDLAAAKTAYRAAAQIAPNDRALKERLKRIDDTEANAARRGQKR